MGWQANSVLIRSAFKKHMCFFKHVVPKGLDHMLSVITISLCVCVCVQCAPNQGGWGVGGKMSKIIFMKFFNLYLTIG